jgi:hypothetical protein
MTNKGTFLNFLPMYISRFIVLFSFSLFFVSCASESEQSFTENEINEFTKNHQKRAVILERNGLKLTEIIDYPRFSEAKLKLLSDNIRFVPGINVFEFKIENFTLGAVTVDQEKFYQNDVLAVQNMVIINNNKLVKQNTESSADIDLSLGENKIFVFLNRSFNIGLKNPESSLFFKVNIDDKSSSYESLLPDSILYVTQPRGTYIGANAEKIIFDFMLHNIKLQNGSYVSLYINDTEFKIDFYAPFWIEGLDYGRHKIAVYLKDNEGKILNSIINPDNEYFIELKELSLFD